MAKNPITIDFSAKQFDERMELLLKKLTPEGVRLGLGRAGNALLTDALDEAPLVPMDESTLRGSGSVHVNGILEGTSEGRGKDGTPAISISEPRRKHEATVVVGFNTPYAARLHEHPEYNFQQQNGGEGADYLGSKMASHADDYIKIIGTAVRKEWRRQNA